jgi:hypothetical protein
MQRWHVSDVFLSYSRDDLSSAALVARALEAAGLTVFWDQRLSAGDVWDELIEREANTSRCIVVLWSRRSVESRWVRAEASVGLKRGNLVPASLDGTEPPLAFRLHQTARLDDLQVRPEAPGIHELINGVQAKLRAAAPPSMAVDIPPLGVQNRNDRRALPLHASSNAAGSSSRAVRGVAVTRWIVAFALISIAVLIGLAASYFGRTPPKSYALLLGIGNYRYLASLPSPRQDVGKMGAFLKEQGFDEVVTVVDDYVTPDTFRFPRRLFRGDIGPNDRFVLYYSGHGIAVGEGDERRGFLPTSDEREEGGSKSIPMDSLVDAIENLGTRHFLIILESCFSSFASIRQKAPFRGRTEEPEPIVFQFPGVSLEVKRNAPGRARFLLTAGANLAFSGQRWNGALFTEGILRGAQGAADGNADARVTVRELSDWVQSFVMEEASKINAKASLPILDDLGPEGRSDEEFAFDVHRP